MNWLIYLFILVALGFTLVRVWKIVEINRRRSSSQIWTPATGRVTDKKIRNAARGMYYPEITYTYTVLGTEYQNKFSMGSSMLSKARSAMESVGGEISLHYNPQNPKEGYADLERVGAWDIYLVVMGVMATLICLFILLGDLGVL